jgi:putative DNA primase/helicase
MDTTVNMAMNADSDACLPEQPALRPLAPDHRIDLRKSGLSDATIATAGIEAVPPGDFKRVLGYDIPDVISAYRIPFASGFERIKVFYILGAKAKSGKKLRKYHQKKNTGNHLYIPATLAASQLAAGNVPIYVTEGEKKTLKAIQEGLVCIGITGLWNWKRKGTDLLIADFATIPLLNREVILVPDSDWQAPDKNLVQAVERLAQALLIEGAIVKILTLPEEGDEKVGLDDFLVKHGIDKFRLLTPKTFPVEAFSRVANNGMWFYETEKVPVKAADGRKTGEWVEQFKRPIKIADAIEILAYVRSDVFHEWGKLLLFVDKEGNRHSFVMQAEHMARDGEAIRKALLTRGLYIHPFPKYRNAFNLYLQTTEPAHRVFALCTQKTGWHGNTFVLPDTPPIGSTERPVVYVGNMDTLIACNGTLEEWREQVSMKCIGNSRLAFGLSLAFAAALLGICRRENGGFHMRGKSSLGKTTVSFVTVSVWGNPSYMKSWKATINGLEGIAAAHNDLPLVLDEIGQAESKDVGSAAYMLANGEGKIRANQEGEARKTKKWRLLLLSNGEKSMADMVNSDGRKIKAGQEIRLCDIPADTGKFGIFENLHGHGDGGKFSKALTSSTSEHYGHAGIEFLRQVIDRKDEIIELVDELEKRFESALPTNSDGQVKRVANRFALIAAAGEIATRFGITGWPKNTAIEASLRCMCDWIAARGGVVPHEIKEALGQIRRFFENHGSARFSDWEFPESVVHNRAGFRRKAPDDAFEYYVLPETFRNEICTGLDVPYVTSLLIERGILKHGGNSATVNTRLPGLGQQRCYHITAKVMEVE